MQVKKVDEDSHSNIH